MIVRNVSLTWQCTIWWNLPQLYHIFCWQFFSLHNIFFMFLLVHWLNLIIHVLLSPITYKFNVHVQFGYVLCMVWVHWLPWIVNSQASTIHIHLCIQASYLVQVGLASSFMLSSFRSFVYYVISYHWNALLGNLLSFFYFEIKVATYTKERGKISFKSPKTIKGHMWWTRK